MFKRLFLLSFLGVFVFNLYSQIPEKDPEAKEEVKLLSSVKNVHPRLLFGPEI